MGLFSISMELILYSMNLYYKVGLRGPKSLVRVSANSPLRGEHSRSTNTRKAPPFKVALGLLGKASVVIIYTKVLYLVRYHMGRALKSD